MKKTIVVQLKTYTKMLAFSKMLVAQSTFNVQNKYILNRGMKLTENPFVNNRIFS